MAEPEHLEIVRGGAEAIAEWRASNPGVKLKLKHADLSNANLREAPLAGASLAGANLSRAKLSRADLSRADLSRAVLSRSSLLRADLSRATLLRAELVRADLTESDLSGAHLHGANMSEAVLSGADLTGARLSEANLNRAGLTGADLSQAITSGTLFNGTVLTRTRGLETVRHAGPSSIGSDTLSRSKGGIPEVFLRGCGLSDWEILAARLHDPELSPEQQAELLGKIGEARRGGVAQLHSVFISYSHSDRPFATALCDALQEQGVRCWLDEHQVLPGEKILSRVAEGIQTWDKFLLCCSEAALTSWWVDKEIGIVFAKEERLWRERGGEALALIPLDLDGHLFDWENPRAAEIRERLALDFRGCPQDREKFETGVDRLVRALVTLSP